MRILRRKTKGADRDGPRASERAFAEECQAMLDGRLADLLVEQHRPVPPWVWTNLLAHGDVTAINLAASERRQPATSSADWYRARAFLAGEVINAARRCGSLSRLQRTVLIPLELEVASLTRTWAMQPDEWTLTVIGALVGLRNCNPPRFGGSVS